MFRHTYSTMLSEHGDDVKVVQELMRHVKLSTTMETHTSETRRKSVDRKPR